CQAAAWTNPELELSAEDWPVSAGRGFSDAKQLAGISQTVPFPGKKRLDRHIGLAGLRLSEAALAQRRLDLVREVKAAFFQVLATERLVAVERELVQVADDFAVAARKRVEAGAAGDQEQLRAEILLEEARSDLAGFEREWDTARENLALLAGRPELTSAKLTGALATQPNPALLQLTPESSLAGHPRLLAARRSREQAESEARRAGLEPYPDLTLGLAGGREGETGNSIIQVSVSIPLPIFDRSKGRQQAARANVTAAAAEQDSVAQQLKRDWMAARRRLQTAATQVQTCEQRILPKANQALHLVKTGFEEGKFGFIDLLDTQRTAAEAQLAYQQRLLELNLAQADLEALAGLPADHTEITQSLSK
ncbi:MAG TPA: TolC family protein, partial [Clostridia bacterium]|nr:TolC family protein [Clostridia bacterium]